MLFSSQVNIEHSNPKLERDTQIISYFILYNIDSRLCLLTIVSNDIFILGNLKWNQAYTYNSSPVFVLIFTLSEISNNSKKK